MVKIKLIMLSILVWGKLLAQETVPFNSNRYEFHNNDYRMGEYLGRPAVALKNNRMLLKDIGFENGVIEFDVAFQPVRAFVGIAFRVKDTRNYEEFYLRPHQSGNPDANQYCPVNNGVSSWQLYTGEGYTAPAHYLYNNWTHCKLVISGNRMDVYINDMRKPAMVSALKRATQAGGIALYSSLGEAWFSEFKITRNNNPVFLGPLKTPLPPEPGTILTWQVSAPFSEKSLERAMVLTKTEKQSLTWRNGQAENSGLLNLAAIAEFTQTNNTVFAKLIIESDKAQIKKISLGFSDRVKVYLNNQILFSAYDAFQSRDYRFLGTIGYFDDVYLSLINGRNELWISVSENFGGWAIQGKITDQSGIRILN
jgi:hypothetical protein